MGASRDFLPFPRGSTASGGPINPTPTTATAPTSYVYGTPIGGPNGLVGGNLPTTLGVFLAANQYRPDLAGFIGRCRDTICGTGVPMLLRAVQNGAYWLRVGRLAIGFAQVTKQHGIVAIVAGSSTTGVISQTAGVPAKLIDPAYALGSWIAPYDWFWCVEEGPALGTITDGVSVTGAEWALMAYTDGTLSKCTAGLFPVGTSDVACTATDSNLSGATLYYPSSGVETAPGQPVTTTTSLVWCNAGIGKVGVT
jgi:hypothetical protein